VTKNFLQKSFAPPPATGYMLFMLTIFAILCVLALVALFDVWLSSITSEVPTVSPALALTRADAMEATEVATRASDYARIRAAANRFGGRVPTRTRVAALRIANLAADIACEPRAALLAAVGTLDTADEAGRLQRDASAAREDLPGLLDRFAACPSSPILDEIVTEIVERR
jgi:hypothetical protein